MTQPIKFAILGAGNIAHTMARTVTQMPEVVPYAVAARELDRAQAFATQYGFSRAYGSYEQLLADPQVELVYIATPHSHHAAQALACLEAGKHVLCEKAFTVNAHQARQVLDTARQKGLLVAEAIWPRYMPMAQRLREVCQSGIIGRVHTLTADLGYSVFARPRIHDPALAGGALLDVGIYPLTFAAIAFGSQVEGVSSTAVMADTGVDAQNSVLLTYAGGRMAVLHSSVVAVSHRAGALQGEDGFAVVENVNNYESIRVYDRDRVQIAEYRQPRQITGFEYEVRACAEAIRAGQVECPQMPHREILRMMELMDTIRGQWGLRYPFE